MDGGVYYYVCMNPEPHLVIARCHGNLAFKSLITAEGVLENELNRL